jgi:hypothetical protein
MSVASLEAAIKSHREKKAALEKLYLRSGSDRLIYAERERQLRLHERSIEVERGIVAFLEACSRQEFASTAQFVALLYRNWYALLENVCGVYERPCDELRCDEQCLLEYKCILPLCPSLKIFGCTRHATTHHCGHGRCNVTLTTQQWTKVCLFSGVEVGQELAAVTSLATEMRPENSGGMSAFNVFAAHKLAASVVGELQSQNAASEAEQRMWLERIDRGERLNIVNPVMDSKRVVRKTTQAEWRSFRFGTQVAAAAQDAERRLVATATSVVNDILFNGETRSLLNIQLLAEARRKARTALHDYHSQCRIKGVLPCIITAATHFHAEMRRFEPLPDVPADSNRRARLVNHCVRLWEICHKSPFMRRVLQSTPLKNEKQQSSCSFVQFCVTVLFMYTTGLYIQRSAVSGFICSTECHIFVPQQMCMRVQLPPEDRLDAFGPQSTQKMFQHISASDVPDTVGVGSASFRSRKQDTLYNNKNELIVRKRSDVRRLTAASSGHKQITVQASVNGDRIAATEREVLPSHLHSSLVGEPGRYSKTYLQIGRNFLRACLNSFDEEELARESKWLFAT